MGVAIVKILLTLLLFGISWGLTIGLVYLICLCFSWKFSLLIATGIWLILLVIKLMFPSK
jgi:hypothetical protein